jgi:hypothetical protein
MKRTSTSLTADIPADPFGEQARPPRRTRMHVLGGEFEFESDSDELHELVSWAYDRLPRHELSGPAPQFRIRLAVAAPAPARAPRDHKLSAPRIHTLAGADYLCGTSAASTFAVLSTAQRSALVVVARSMLRFRYHLRYELLEFVVFTLAQRVQGLVPLHAACIGSAGRGVLVVGDSGAGKSTTALHWLLRGHEFVAEDSLFVEPGSLLATGVANFLHVRRESLRFVAPAVVTWLRRSPRIRRRSGVEKLEIDARRPEFHLAPRALEIAAVVFLSARHATRGRLLHRVGRTELRARLRASQPYAAHQPGWERFSQQIRAVPAFELQRGQHPDRGIEALEGLLTHVR